MGIFHSLSLYSVAFFIVVIAFIVRGTIGFGSGLIAVASLILLMPVKLAVPLVFLLDLTAALVLGSYDAKQVVWRDVLWLLPFASVGVFIGGFILKKASPGSVTFILGLFILVYVLYALWVKLDKLPKIRTLWAIPLGLLGGLAGSLYGGGGPPLVAYLQLRKLDKRQFRATMQLVAGMNNVLRGILYVALGLLTLPIGLGYLALLPAMLLGLWIGNKVHLRINAKLFQEVVLVVLTLVGLKLMIPV
ncbi:sulfite exporter TauE/SafE family protein [Sulfobacillus thermosulfidooxidans]|uniref:sulfite exporter TauE/SafE family protein n=1 Tax=Sulfobacillus thermosulfidooxidans TaxID=28034 RepID=UPI0004100C39|nr:sulfite exporter TauE/SafE family protein [Sulfobacillus thermosulfidooxidans]OLZ08065.1 hypothetical protein BFX05_04595 [Sulfobacillus thermosulfidooxidans]OLZ16479.1 hypothetical protein BFX06_14980 [Sulfobacillus thermosulfidooxidans]OLZ19566.1 hypothetical protein BFX07_02555 [Sulfobacillus thermosulfidooxidans]